MKMLLMGAHSWLAKLRRPVPGSPAQELDVGVSHEQFCLALSIDTVVNMAAHFGGVVLRISTPMAGMWVTS